MTRTELWLAVKLVLIPVYLLALRLAATVLAETPSVFDYGRF